MGRLSAPARRSCGARTVRVMEASSIRVPWWWVAITALALTAVIAAMHPWGFVVQVVVSWVVLMVLVVALLASQRPRE